MLITDKDTEFIKKLSALSLQKENTVKDVLKALLYCSTLEILRSFDDEDYVPEITIPYICNLKMEHSDVLSDKGVVTDVKLTAEPHRALLQEFICCLEGDTTPSESQIKKIRENKLFKKLEL